MWATSKLGNNRDACRMLSEQLQNESRSQYLSKIERSGGSQIQVLGQKHLFAQNLTCSFSLSTFSFHFSVGTSSLGRSVHVGMVRVERVRVRIPMNSSFVLLLKSFSQDTPTSWAVMQCCSGTHNHGGRWTHSLIHGPPRVIVMLGLLARRV